MIIIDRDQYTTKIAGVRTRRLQAFAKRVGRQGFWGGDLTEAQTDNDECDTAMESGNHPIQNEAQAEYERKADLGAGMLRIGAHAASDHRFRPAPSSQTAQIQRPGTRGPYPRALHHRPIAGTPHKHCGGTSSGLPLPGSDDQPCAHADDSGAGSSADNLTDAGNQQRNVDGDSYLWLDNSRGLESTSKESLPSADPMSIIREVFGPDANTSLAIATAESGLNCAAYSSTNDGGLFQINLGWHTAKFAGRSP
jgi:hypothetical protein